MDEKNQNTQSLNWKDLQVLKFPKWYEEEFHESKFDKFQNRILGKRTRYEDYFIAQLRSVYMDLEGDLRTLIPEYSGMTNEEERRNADEIGNYIANLLNASKGMLEKQKLKKRQMLIVSSLLQEIEECLVWITPPALALAKTNSLSSKLNQLDSPDKGMYKELLNSCKDFLESFKDKYGEISRAETENYRARLEEVIRFVSTESLKESINIGLQIERLRTLRYWGVVLLSILILIFPIVSNPAKLSELRMPLFGLGALENFSTAICFTIIGGVGGFLSGLQQVRASKTNLGDYEISVLLFQLRPILGAFAALILVALMSRDVLNDVLQQSSGSYILAALASGFSERYFINLLKLESDEKTLDYEDKTPQQTETKTNGAGG